MTAGKGYDYVSTRPDYHRGGRSETDWDLGGWSRSMTWPACKHVPCPYCRYAGIVMLEEKIFSNILIDWHFIHITLACKWLPNYYAN